MREVGSSSATSGMSVSSRLTDWLDLDVAHVDLLVHDEHGGPTLLLAPMFGAGGFKDIDYLYLCSVVFDPLFSSFVYYSHEISLRVISLILIWSMIIHSFMEDNPNDSVLASWL